MVHFNLPRPTRPELTRESLGLTNHVTYDKYNPHDGNATDARKSLSGLDYSPLRRVTWASLWMGLLISMGGFIFGYDTVSLLLLVSFTTLMPFRVKSVVSWRCQTF
jgi:hypothetical protein